MCEHKITYPKNSPEYFKLYYEKNKDEIKEKKKEYYSDENIKNKLKEKYQNTKEDLLQKIMCTCGSTVTKKHLTRHMKTNKHLSNI